MKKGKVGNWECVHSGIASSMAIEELGCPPCKCKLGTSHSAQSDWTSPSFTGSYLDSSHIYMGIMYRVKSDTLLQVVFADINNYKCACSVSDVWHCIQRILPKCFNLHRGWYFSFSMLVRNWRAAASNERVTDSWSQNYSLAWLQFTRLQESSYVDIVNTQEPVLFFHLVSPNFVYEILIIHDNVSYIAKVLLLFNLFFYFHLGATGFNYFDDFSKVTLITNVYSVMNRVEHFFFFYVGI